MESMILQGDCLEKLKELEDQSIDCCVTSPPYYALRNYGIKEQIGLESTFEEYIRFNGETELGEVARSVYV